MMTSLLTIVVLGVFLLVQLAQALNNGLARTPPMGFMTWQRFRCITDCHKYPDECISERLIQRTADKMVEDGYLKAGYEYLIIDDCWLAKERDQDGKLQADKSRFPNGMKAVSDYVHAKGLKFGIYEDYGNKTCGGYPGILGHLKKDAEYFAYLEVDYIKIDGCYSVPFYEMEDGYKLFGKYLNETGRPMVYSCSWPAYFNDASYPLNYEILKEHCNLWRNYDDIQDSYQSLTQIMDWFALVQDSIIQHAGPGHWNDPDMLLAGNYALTRDQAKMQMAVWAILAAPLLMSVDLHTIKHEFKEILQHKELIEINQDPWGLQGRRVLRERQIEIWKRELKPEDEYGSKYAVVIVSRREDGTPYPYNVTLQAIGLTHPNGYYYRDVFKHNETELQYVQPKSFITVRVVPQGCVVLKVFASKENKSENTTNSTTTQ
nr:PREDICTED: alpha-N-acetylgalactosaminidase-like [Bemisia tabaci]